MKKLVIVIALICAGMGLNGVNAQDKQDKKDVSIGVQGAFNPNKTGVGVRLGFDFTEILRFTLDGTYYLTAKKTMDVFQGETITRTLNQGRLWDGNINLNFVFGRNNFHFYLITGLGITYGYKFNGLTDALGGFAYDHTDANGNSIGYGIDEDHVTEAMLAIFNMLIHEGLETTFFLHEKGSWSKFSIRTNLDIEAVQQRLSFYEPVEMKEPVPHEVTGMNKAIFCFTTATGKNPVSAEQIVSEIPNVILIYYQYAKLNKITSEMWAVSKNFELKKEK